MKIIDNYQLDLPVWFFGVHYILQKPSGGQVVHTAILTHTCTYIHTIHTHTDIIKLNINNEREKHR